MGPFTATRWLSILVCCAASGCGDEEPPYEVPAIVHLAGSPTSLALDSENVYVTSTVDPASTGLIERASKRGGRPEAVAEAADPTTSLALDELGVYFLTYRDGPLRVDKTGGAVTALWAQCATCWDLAVDADTVYFTEWFSVEGFVRSLPKEPGSASTELASDLGLPVRLVIDEARVYWGNQAGEVWSVAKTGGDAVRLATSAGLADFVALDGDFVYFTSGGRGIGVGRVSRVPKLGGDVEVLADVADGNEGVRGLCIANGRVYVGSGDGIHSLPLAGGSPKLLRGTQGLGNDIETDGEFIYWISSLGTVHRLPVSGE